MGIDPHGKTAIWALTPNGMVLAHRLKEQWPSARLFCSRRLLYRSCTLSLHAFDRLGDAIAKYFSKFQGHIFIMATGIVVRSIAPHLHHKTKDPAVVVVDDHGQFAISLISGHLGGANVLAHQTAECLQATPVITTATDVNGKPAIDLLAAQHGLRIENPQCIKNINMALLTQEPVRLYDPDGWLENTLPEAVAFSQNLEDEPQSPEIEQLPGVWIDHTISKLHPSILVLRPPTLVVGIGCNRHTSKEDIHDFLFKTMARFGLAAGSLSAIASIDLKSDEVGLCALAVDLDLPIHFFTREELARAENIQTPSSKVAKHVGVPSVCEAAAILASQNGRLIVPKKKNSNITIAIARRAFISSG